MPDRESTIRRKVVVFGQRYIPDYGSYEPAYYFADINLTKSDVQHDRISGLAKLQAAEKGELSQSKPMNVFTEEDFGLLRAFCANFQEIDYCEEDNHQQTQNKECYDVSWKTSVIAKSPRDAATEALTIMKDPGKAVEFYVKRSEGHDQTPVFVDLNVEMDIEEDEELEARHN